MNYSDLSMNLVDLAEASRLLDNKVRAPKGMMMTVGEYQEKFYLLDGVANRVSRLTFGAFRHLRDAWQASAVLD
jgi:hypothetical protein